MDHAEKFKRVCETVIDLFEEVRVARQEHPYSEVNDEQAAMVATRASAALEKLNLQELAAFINMVDGLRLLVHTEGIRRVSTMSRDDLEETLLDLVQKLSEELRREGYEN